MKPILKKTGIVVLCLLAVLATTLLLNNSKYFILRFISIYGGGMMPASGIVYVIFAKYIFRKTIENPYLHPIFYAATNSLSLGILYGYLYANGFLSTGKFTFNDIYVFYLFFPAILAAAIVYAFINIIRFAMNSARR